MKRLYTLLILSIALLTLPARSAVVGRHQFAAESKLATGTWVKVSLDGTEDGIYQITYSQLKSFGFSKPHRVAVYGFGGHALPEDVNALTYDDLPEVAVYHDTLNQRILFYGQGLVNWTYHNSKGYIHRQNTYDTKAYYFLCQRNNSADPMPTLPDNATASNTVQKRYDVHLLHEKNSVNIGQSGREKYGESFQSQMVQSFDFEQVDSGQVRVQVNFIANTTSSSTLEASLNGTALGSSVIAKRTNTYAFATETTLDKTTKLLRTSGLSLKLTFSPTDGTPSLARLNYIRIWALRDFKKPQSFELFRSKESYNKIVRYSLGSAVDDDIQVWDVTSAYDVKRQLLSSQNTFCPQQTGIREYALVNVRGTDFPTVKNEGKVANQNLHALPMTNMVIVAAPAYYAHATQLAEYRSAHDQLHVTVLQPEQIYNEFSSGHQDVTAIRMLMKMFYDRYYQTTADTLGVARKPLYLLLWGDGYYDNHTIDRDFNLPCYETDASLVETSSCVCDDYFGFLDDGEGGTLDNNLRYTIDKEGLDIGIGRLPVSSIEQSQSVLNKIISYSDNMYLGTWKSRLCFLSDDDKDGDTYNCHVRHNDELVSTLEQAGHHEFIFQKIYLPAYKQTQSASGTDYPDAKKEFLSALKQGVLMVNYAGHGNTTAITNENMMTASAASELNMTCLPVWVTASCDVSRWDEDGLSLGECLLLNPDGGAIALFSTVRVVYAQQNLTLNKAIIDNIFNRFDDGTRYRLGDVLRASKVELGSDYNKLNFCLLGDPSLTMSFPEQQLQVTEVNGQSVSDPNYIFSLPILSDVTVKGRVLKTGSQAETDSTFQGLVFPTFYDALDTLTADKGYMQGKAPVYTFTTRTKKAFAGRGEVRNGEFSFTFKVPLDISYSQNLGLANLYACSEQGAEGMGYFDRYYLAGSDSYTIPDSVGPVIRQLYLDNASWRDGDVVGCTPFFYAEVEDEGGFNATGNMVGHDIVLTIRCTSNLLLAAEQHNLNNSFIPYTGNPRRGNIQYSIPELEDGTYEATFRIWDVYNNPTTQKFTFTVRRSQTPEAVVVQAYPCPAKMGDSITFRVLHNRPESAQQLTLQLYTQTGYKVLETTTTSSSASTVYAPDASAPTLLATAINGDESGNPMGEATFVCDSSILRPGFYLYRVFLSSNGSNEMSKSQLLMVNP